MSKLVHPHEILTGLLVTLVGYASSGAIVIRGLSAVGANEGEIVSAMVGLAIALGVLGIGLSRWTRMPISIAWSTPGMVLLATVGVGSGGFPAAVGAFVTTGLLVAASGLFEPLGRLVGAIPKPIAAGMLAGVLLKFCLLPFVAIAARPVEIAAIVGVWVVLMRFARLWAAPAAAALALLFMGFDGEGAFAGLSFSWPSVVWVMPRFDLETTISIALPLFLVTMASQNIPGWAVIGANGYHPPFRPLLVATGAVSAALAPIGMPVVNLAAITAALAAGEEAGPDRSRRWIVAAIGGLGHMALGVVATVAVGLVMRSSPQLIEAAAGLALVGAFGGSMKAALDVEADRIPALVTFLVAASGLSFVGIGSAFWALVVGIAVHVLARVGRPSA
ncbi:MAG: benzoate/H(+) symporter BenE family transporter [Phyllobacteriaceae bacterium]|nr:benzoate/H(+) symporter BenE family transporter [Phyllobacteriaceae bacterium]